MTAAEAVASWIAAERAEYAGIKYAENSEGRTTLVAAMREGDWQRWTNFAGNYIRRAELFGFDTPQGRQALGKAIVTLMHTLETAVDVHGPMPPPGVPSGVVS